MGSMKVSKIRGEIYAAIEKERNDQVAAGNTPSGDKIYTQNQLIGAAENRLYAAVYPEENNPNQCYLSWFKKGKNRRECLIQAAALIVAELERMGGEK